MSGTTPDDVIVPRAVLTDLGPVAQLRAGRLARRLPQLYVGLFLYGVSLAMMVRGALGLAPWDVLHSGFIRHVPMTLGQAVVLFSFVVLVLWIPLREMPGLGTISNALVVGFSADLTLAVLDRARRDRRPDRPDARRGRALRRRQRALHRCPARPRAARRPDDRAGAPHRAVAAPGPHRPRGRRRGHRPAARRHARPRHRGLRAGDRSAHAADAAVDDRRRDGRLLRPHRFRRRSPRPGS